MALYNDDNLGKKYEKFLYDYFCGNRKEGTAIEWVKDEVRQKAGADIIVEGVVFDAKSSSKTAETGNLQFDVFESFQYGNAGTYRTGWFFNGTMTDWLVFYVPMGNKLVEYSMLKSEAMNFYNEYVIDAYNLTGNVNFDAEEAKKHLLYNKDKLTQHFTCTKDGAKHYTIIWCPKITELAKYISIFKRVYEFDYEISPVSEDIIYENATLVEGNHRIK